jgi:hypothetical protein
MNRGVKEDALHLTPAARDEMASSVARAKKMSGFDRPPIVTFIKAAIRVFV